MSLTNIGERNLYRHKNGNYYIRFKRQQIRRGPVQMSLRTSDLTTARDMYIQILTMLNYSRMTGDTSAFRNLSEKETRKRLEDSLAEWIKDSESRKLGDTSLYIKKIVRDMILEMGIRYTDEFDQQSLDKFYDALEKKALEGQNKQDYSSGTMQKYNMTLKTFLNFCEKRDYYPTHKLHKLQFRKFKGGRRDASYVMTEEDYHKILNYFKGQPVRQMYLKMEWETGLRPESEGLNIKFNDIHFDDRFIHVKQTKIEKTTACEYKDVVITKEFSRELKEFCDKFKISGDQFLFRGHKWKVRQDDNYISNNFDRIKAKLDLNPKYCLYSFRHTFAMRMYKKTRNVEFVRSQLGHQNLKTTQTYIHSIVNDNINIFDSNVKKNGGV